MAAGNNRDVKMTLSVETLGADEIKKLQDQVQKLAQEGGDAAPEFQKLADEIGRLGSQAEALRAFEQLADATQKVADKQGLAATKVDELAQRLAASRTATETAADSQERAGAAYLASQQEVSRLAGELQKLRGGVGDAEKGTKQYEARLRELIDAKTAATQETKRLQAEQRTANQSLSEAEAAEKRLERQYNASLTQLGKRNDELAKASRELEKSRTETEQAGLATQDLAQTQVQLIQAFNNTGAAAREKSQAIEQTAAAERKAREESERTAKSEAERIASLNAEIRLRQQAAAAREKAAAEERAIEKAKTDAIVAERKREQAESDRLYELQRQTRERLEIQARQSLAAENQAQREAAALTVRLEAEKTAAIQQSANKNAQAITNAFSTVGMRGANELRAEIEKVRGAMDTLSSQAGLTGAELKVAMSSGSVQIRELEREMRAATGQITLADRAAGLLKNSMGQIAAGNLIADGIASVVEKVKAMGRAFIEVTLQAESMRKGLTAIYKDSAVAASQMEFLRRTAVGAGVSISGLVTDFVRFSAATKASNIPLGDTNALFTALTRASSSLGLGADKTSLALNALGQIASKGCHAPGTLIRMADGSTKTVEQVRVGESLFGPDGSARVVLMLAHGKSAMYRIAPQVGESFVVNEEHKMRVNRAGAAETLTVAEYLRLSQHAQAEYSLRHANLGEVAFSVAYENEGDFYGFLISGDHLYLDAQGFEHHNTVSMEELRQQLGDAVPGALSLTAQGLGVTDAQLIKLVESGQLAARDFFPAFTKGLQTLQGETDGVRQTWERFKNVLTVSAQTAEANGSLALLSGTLKVFGFVVGAVAQTLVAAYEGIQLMVKGLVALNAAIKGDFKEAWGFFNEEARKSGERIAAVSDAMSQMLNPTEEGAAAMMRAANAQGRLGSAANSTKDAIKFNTDEIAKNGETARTTEAGALALAEAQRITKGSADASTGSWVALTGRLTELAAQQTQAVTVAEKQAKAVELESQAIERLAGLRGQETASLQAAVTASDMKAGALGRVATARENEAAVMRVQLAEMVKLAIAQDGSTKGREVEIQAIQQKVEKLDAEAASSRNAAMAAQLQLEQARLNQQMNRDNSASLEQYRQTMLATSEAAAQVAEAYRNGRATQGEWVAAEKDAAAAVALYNDALKDKIKLQEVSTKSQQADITLATASLGARKAEVEAMLRTAQAMGDENAVRYAKIEQKRVEIAIIKATVQAQMIEQQSIIEVANAKLEELRRTEPLNKAAQIELETSIKLAEAKIIEAKARGQAVGALESEIRALQNSTSLKDANRNSSEGLGRSLDQEADGRERNAGAIDKETDAMRRRRQLQGGGGGTDSAPNGYTSDGFIANKDGSAAGTFNNNLPVDQAFAVLEAVNTGKLSDVTKEQAQAAYKQALAAQNWMEGTMKVNPAAFSFQAQQDTRAMVAAAMAAMDATGGSTGGSKVSGDGRSTTVVVKFGSKSSSVNTASQADADKLADIFKQLESAAGTAS